MDVEAVVELVREVAALDDACDDAATLAAAAASSARVRAWLDGRDVQVAALFTAIDAQAEQTLARAGRTSTRDVNRVVERVSTTNAGAGAGRLVVSRGGVGWSCRRGRRRAAVV